MGDAHGELRAKDGPGGDGRAELLVGSLVAVQEVEAAFADLDLVTLALRARLGNHEVGEFVDPSEGFVRELERGLAEVAGAEGVAQTEHQIGRGVDEGRRPRPLDLDPALERDDGNPGVGGIGGIRCRGDRAWPTNGERKHGEKEDGARNGHGGDDVVYERSRTRARTQRRGFGRPRWACRARIPPHDAIRIACVARGGALTPSP